MFEFLLGYLWRWVVRMVVAHGTPFRSHVQLQYRSDRHVIDGHYIGVLKVWRSTTRPSLSIGRSFIPGNCRSLWHSWDDANYPYYLLTWWQKLCARYIGMPLCYRFGTLVEADDDYDDSWSRKWHGMQMFGSERHGLSCHYTWTIGKEQVAWYVE